MGIEIWMALVIVFMFILLIYGLVHQNKFIIISSIIGSLFYFIILSTILTNGGSIREFELKKEWPVIESKQGNYAEHLTLFKTTFVHDNKMTAQLNYYTFALSFYEELQIALRDEQAIKATDRYDVMLHSTSKERSSFYETLFNQYETMTLPKDVFYEEIHKTFKEVLVELQQTNKQNDEVQAYLQHQSLIGEEQPEPIEHLLNKQVEQLETLTRYQQQLDEQMQQLTKHLGTTISNKLND